MTDPLDGFNWKTLFDQYKSLCRGFKPSSPHLAALQEKPGSDPDLYGILIDRFHRDINQHGQITYDTYRAMLYWKHYSWAAARTRNVDPVGDSPKKEEVQQNLQRFPRVFHDDKLDRNTGEITRLIVAMDELDLYGMGPGAFPTRSTFLHFLYPTIVPVFDRKVLFTLDLLKKRDLSGVSAKQKLYYFEKYLEQAWSLEQKHLTVLKSFSDVTPIRALEMALWIEADRLFKSCKTGKKCKHMP